MAVRRDYPKLRFGSSSRASLLAHALRAPPVEQVLISIVRTRAMFVGIIDLLHPKRGGEGGIRTLGTLLRYGALAKRCFRPLSHLTCSHGPADRARTRHRRVATSAGENMTKNCRLPTPTSVATSIE